MAVAWTRRPERPKRREKAKWKVVTDAPKIDLLVHNVTHSDVVISFGDREDGDDEYDDDATLLALPRFSKFAKTCEELLDAATKTIAYARAGRRELNRREYPVLRYEEDDDEQPVKKRGRRRSRQPQQPMLYRSASASDLSYRTAAGIKINATEWASGRLRTDLKVRRTEVRRLIEDENHPATPRRVYFPLLAVCVNAWLEEVCETTSQKVVLLVTGTGTPRDETAKNDPRGNSTCEASKLMEIFLRTHYQNVDVVLLHSESNIFRYDENISFVRHELLPTVAKIRNSVVDPYSSSWASRFKVAVTSGDGAPARVAALQRSLRVYKPTGVHVWQPKTFWQYRVLSKDDVEVLPFDVTETIPPIPISQQVDGDIRRLVDETKRLRDHFYNDIVHKPNDIAAFWHRKSKKVVIAVLLVRKSPDDPGRLYHGVNLEVSMPTGSLCAERCAIGAALADDLSLIRSALKLIAVLGLHLPPDLPDDDATSTTTTVESSPRILPRSSSTRKRKVSKLLQDDDDPQPQAHNDETTDHPPPRHDDDPTDDDDNAPPPRSSSKSPRTTTTAAAVKKIIPSRQQIIKSYPKISRDDFTTPASTSRIYSVTHGDMNPLRPCGACAEWLKKIASVNPDFSVVTFTDAECRGGIYIESAVDY